MQPISDNLQQVMDDVHKKIREATAQLVEGDKNPDPQLRPTDFQIDQAIRNAKVMRKRTAPIDRISRELLDEAIRAFEKIRNRRKLLN